MFNKTTSSNFMHYGGIVNQIPDIDLVKTEFTIADETVYQLASFDQPVYIEPKEGMAMLYICQNPELDTVEKFALHRTIRINPGNYFRLVAMSHYIVFHFYAPENIVRKNYALEKPIYYHHITPKLRVKEIIAYYYVVKRPKYFFPGETHQYFELTYVDQGTLTTKVNQQEYVIGVNHAMIYTPTQFHDQQVTSEGSCSYLTVIFKADGIDLERIQNRVFACNREMVNNIQRFVTDSDQDDPYQNDALVSSLENFIIALHRDESNQRSKPTTPVNQHYEDQLLEEIIDYINLHLYDPLPIDQICTRFAISRSTLQNLFKNNLQVSPKHYINQAKLNMSRILIRKGTHTITEIASQLGFNSIHYFSRKFTQTYGITPSDYAKKIYDQIN